MWQSHPSHRYYKYDLFVNGDTEHHGTNYEEDYMTDLMGRKAQSFFDNYLASEERKPFLIFVSTPATHGPFTPAPQYENAYPEIIAPR